jgi:hypothetical protein
MFINPSAEYLKVSQELIRYTPKAHSEFQSLEAALEAMKDVAHSINEIKRKRENEKTLQELQSRIDGYEVKSTSHLGSVVNALVNLFTFALAGAINHEPG